MKLTPLDIRQKKFEKTFRGLDQDEVTAFLKTMSKEWEVINEEKRILEIKLQTKKEELGRLIKVEDTLFKTLSTAEETGKTIIEQATKESELKLKQSNIEADNIIDSAKRKAEYLIENAKQVSNNHLDQTISKLKNLQNQLISLSDSYENIISQINSLTEIIRDNTDRKKENFDFSIFKTQILESQSELSKLLIDNSNIPVGIPSTPNTKVKDKETEIDPKITNNINTKTNGEKVPDVDFVVSVSNDEVLPLETKVKEEKLEYKFENNTEWVDQENIEEDLSLDGNKSENVPKNPTQSGPITLSFFDEV